MAWRTTCSASCVSLEDMGKMIKKIYVERVGEKVRQRLLVLMMFTFFGVKRFSDVNRIKVKNVIFKERRKFRGFHGLLQD